ncbi:unnamed protein product [Nezara viridula]|uniref:Cadherin domain-containing protein n=1 Tax=Nezara viridula TaxID=85310 RepID=A0A9P0H7F0_NEZVI|nr:unnamed protein product [Nezara viridula]
MLQVKVRVRDKNDSPPSWEGSKLEFAVSEDLGVGEKVGTLSAVDPDTIGETHYSLISGAEGRFRLEPQGVLRLAEPRLRGGCKEAPEIRLYAAHLTQRGKVMWRPGTDKAVQPISTGRVTWSVSCARVSHIQLLFLLIG